MDVYLCMEQYACTIGLCDDVEVEDIPQLEYEIKWLKKLKRRSYKAVA